MLIDHVTITVKAGCGGDGKVSFKRNAQTAKGGPDGGNGGKGGDVYLQGISDIAALSLFAYKKEVKAEDGIPGGKNNLFGRKGKDLLIRLPIGTLITNVETGEILEIVNESNKILFAKGGAGGRGNNEFKSAIHQTPKEFEKGFPGVVKKVRLELRLIADIGFIGLPNAGKSSLLKTLTNANPKIGNYPFTTLEPNLGVMDGMVLADIPGLIEGASKGKGLGIEFLRHVEKTTVLVHCIDIQQQDLEKAYRIVRSELQAYNLLLLTKPEILLLTKSDEVSNNTQKTKLSIAKKLNKKAFLSSIIDQKQLDTIRTILHAPLDTGV